MLKTAISKYIINAIISSMKGKKRWLVILVLAALNIAQVSGFEIDGFDALVEELINLINAEG